MVAGIPKIPNSEQIVEAWFETTNISLIYDKYNNEYYLQSPLGWIRIFIIIDKFLLDAGNWVNNSQERIE